MLRTASDLSGHASCLATACFEVECMECYVQGLPLPWQQGHPGLAAILGLGRNSTAPTLAASPVTPPTAGDSSPDPGSDFWEGA